SAPEADPLPGAPEGTKDPRSPECRIRTNLSLALEAMGDAAAAEGDDAMAAARYAEAWEVLDPCVASQENRETGDRQKDKEEGAEEESTADPSPDPTETPTPDPTETPTPDPTDSPSADAPETPSPDPSEGPTPEPT